ncbi:MAG: NAD-dependent epimerase/dehydratase family protein [Promethearchaeota archaeon]
MRILLTGAFGNVGLSVLKELIDRDYDVRILEIKNRKNLRISRKIQNDVEILWGDITNKRDVEKAVKNRDVIIHLAAIIPPLADYRPKLAESVNVGGTVNILESMKKQANHPKIIFTSSIAVYGDRVNNPMIKVTDPLNPSKGDFYALTKISAERLVKESGLDHAIFRLTYITSINKLELDPLMFHMPLETSIEICDTRDVGLALTNAVECFEVWGRTFHIAGGKSCRITYREYLNDMMVIMGLGRGFLPDEAFGKDNFHCGFMETQDSQGLLKYQRHTLEDYYADVKKKTGHKGFFIARVKRFVKIHLLKKSESYKRFKFFKKKIGSFTVSENKLIRRLLSRNFKKIDMLETKIEELEKIISTLCEENKKVEILSKIL